MSETQVIPATEREAGALQIVKKHVPWAVGAGVIPLPGADIAALLVVQQRMLCKLAEHYGLTYRKEASKTIVASLLGDVTGATLSGGLVSLAKLIPGVGTVVGIVSLPAFAGAVTYAVGRVFISHFESGGTFLNLKPEALRAHFREEFAKAGSEAEGKAAA